MPSPTYVCDLCEASEASCSHPDDTGSHPKPSLCWPCMNAVLDLREALKANADRMRALRGRVAV